jgi:hypothetical protein
MGCDQFRDFITRPCVLHYDASQALPHRVFEVPECFPRGQRVIDPGHSWGHFW